MTHTLAELDVMVGALTEAQNDKMDTDGRNGTNTVDYVVEWKAGTNSDPSWYRLYKSGWLEQGGTYTYTGSNAGFYTMTYPKAFKDTNYSITGTGYRSDGSPYQGFCTFKDWTTTGCGVAFWDDSTSNQGVIKWMASGMGAD